MNCSTAIPERFSELSLRVLAVAVTIVVFAAGCHELQRSAQPGIVASMRSVPNLDDIAPRLAISSMSFPDALRKVSDATGIRIDPDTIAFEAAGIDPAACVEGWFRGVSTRVILVALLSEVGNDFVIEEDGPVVRVTTRMAARRVSRDLNVQDILNRWKHYGYEKPVIFDGDRDRLSTDESMERDLEDTVTTFVTPEQWQHTGGEFAQIRIEGGHIFVTHNTAGIRAIEQLLAEIRRADLQDPTTNVAADRFDDRLDRIIDLDGGLTMEQALARSADQADVSIAIHWKQFTSCGITPETKLDGTPRRGKLGDVLRSAIKSVSNDAFINMAIYNGVIVVSSDVYPQPASTRVYNVRTLVDRFTDAGASKMETTDGILALIAKRVAPDSWRDAGGSAGSFQQMMGLILISHVDNVQDEIAELLERLRRSKNKIIDPRDFPESPTTTQ